MSSSAIRSCFVFFLSEDEAALKAKGQQPGRSKGGNRKSPKVVVKGEKKEEEKGSEEKNLKLPAETDSYRTSSSQESVLVSHSRSQNSSSSTAGMSRRIRRENGVRIYGMVGSHFVDMVMRRSIQFLGRITKPNLFPVFHVNSWYDA